MSSERIENSDALNPAFSRKGLREAVRHGSRRTLFAQLASHLISLIVLASLYHLIAPGDFGLIGMALPVIMFLRVFTSLGMNVATVQSRDLTPALISRLFWLHVALGTATAVAAAAVAPAVAWFYREPQVRIVLVALAATSLASAVGLQHIALLERNLRLGSAAACRLAGQGIGGLLAIALAVAGWGVWALVIQQYVELLALAVLAWYLEPWRPSLSRGRETVKHTLRFGGYFTTTQIVLNLLANADKILVGFLLGREALGFYSQAYNVMTKPIVVLTTPLTSIMLPALSRAAHDPPNYSQIVLGFQRLLAVASFPAGIGLMIVGRETMLALGGPQWVDAGPLLMILAATILVQGFINMAGTIFISAGHWRAMLVGSLAMLAALVPGLLAGYLAGRAIGDAMPGVHWIPSDVSDAAHDWLPPMLGMAWGFSLTTCLILFLPYMLFCLRLVDVSPADWTRQLARPALAALGMGAIVLITRVILVSQVALGPAALLLAEIAVGVAAYLLLASREIRWCLEQIRRF
ncbi:MAG TPA: lipopolysaccharide biosynthesis protein [Pirellulales bacterium]|nr:lipopolysaccharide biosynthesis protein [Pirellulales bacterium]